MTGDSGARLRVDPIACDGRGLCAEALPELITLDDWGFPITSGQPVPAWLLADAARRPAPARSLRSGWNTSARRSRLATPAASRGQASDRLLSRGPSGIAAAPPSASLAAPVTTSRRASARPYARALQPCPYWPSADAGAGDGEPLHGGDVPAGSRRDRYHLAGRGEEGQAGRPRAAGTAGRPAAIGAHR